MSLDALIDTLISDAQLGAGEPVGFLLAKERVARAAPRGKAVRAANWTKEEEQFYLDHLKDLTIEQIAAALGRTPNAVKIHQFRNGLPSHRRTPGYLSSHQVAIILGVDSHAPPVWIDAGIMPGERVPYEQEVMRRLTWTQFKMWLIRPTSWIYFKVNRIKNPSIRRLVELAQARWGDEWWTMRQVADYHGVDTKTVYQVIRRARCSGRAVGFHALKLGGRHSNQAWAYWFLRRSEAVQIKIRRGKGNFQRYDWSPRADAFLLKAKAEGKTWSEIGRMMKWNPKQAAYRWYCLTRTKSGKHKA